VTPLDFPLLTDENIAPDVVAGLRARGLDLRTVRDEQLIGRQMSRCSNVRLLRAVSSSRMTWPLPVPHSVPEHPLSGLSTCAQDTSRRDSLQIVDALRASTVDVVPPFIAVAERHQTTVRVRVRTAPPW
jgi:hypothetical protein